VSDSIGHFAFSGTGPAHWFDRLTKFVNHGIALDEPGMTALRPSSTYTTDFYGVTVAGSVATGTTGPLAESLILDVGASITFVGVYETIGVHYDQQAGAGTLSFAYNGGAAFHTVSASGATVLDQFSSAVTEQAASGTYTITATGGPVTITGLTRLGVKVVGSMPRMYTNRCAHGNYALASFQSPGRTSIMKQGRAFGGEAVPIIALGINDSFATIPSTIAANADAVVDDFIAQGAPEIFAILPLRPTNASISFTPAQGTLAGVYRRKGVKIIPMPVNFGGRGLFQDTLHPNVLGNDTYAQLCIEGICKR
jgi:hypothetical protein